MSHSYTLVSYLKDYHRSLPPRQPGSDASWKDDAEIPGELQDFSDDEMEKRQHKSKREGKRKATPNSNSSPAHQQAKKQAPRYSGDPKMSAYFPRLTRPQQSARPQHPPHPGGNFMGRQPPLFQGASGGGGAYFTPRGFVGFMPPGVYSPRPPAG